MFQGFSEQMMYYEFHWNIEDKSDSKANDERKEKAKQDSGSADAVSYTHLYENCGSCFAAKQFVDIKLGAKCLLTLTSFYK